MHDTLLLLHAAATLYMVGLIWMVQLVHYPLIAFVGHGSLAEWQAANLPRTTWAVGPPMLLELATTVLLVVIQPAAVPGWASVLGAILLGVIWVSTALVQVPLHDAILRADPSEARAAVHRLVRSNWARTVLWSMRGLLALVFLGRAMG